MDKVLLSLKETMEYLGLGDNQVRDLIRKESFGCRIGNRLYSNKPLLDDWLLTKCAKTKK